MDIKGVSFLRSNVLFGLLLFVHLSGTLASASLIQSTVCASDHLTFSKSHDRELLFKVNGNSVDETRFCEAVQFHKANGCIFKGFFWNDFCVLHPLLGRKVLQQKVMEESEKHGIDQENDLQFVSMPKKIAIAASGLFLLCCAFVCPCFQKERKATTREVLSEDRNAVDQVSSLEMNSPSETVEPSPLRVPPSPRYTMSPRPNRIGPSLHLSMSQIVKATNNFSENLKIGEGGFGVVYKGYLEDGQVVAIKRAKKEHFGNLRTEFKSQVELLSKIDHRNLVKLLGYVDKGNEKLIMTEYVANGTLRDHLDGARGKILDFNQRLEIAINVCHGLTYLHLYSEKQIVHRDVKSSNIVLTERMRAKVADFGFARSVLVDPNQTHVSTQVKGTVGYLDPEYMRTYQLTPKSDVYSFGILLVEILTGRRPVEAKRPVDERITVRWAFDKYNEGNIMELVDPLLGNAMDVKIAKKMFRLAFNCAAPIRDDRPEMKAVGEQLWDIRADYFKRCKRG